MKKEEQATIGPCLVLYEAFMLRNPERQERKNTINSKQGTTA